MDNKFALKLANTINDAMQAEEKHIDVFAEPVNEELLDNIDIGLNILLERKQPKKPSCFLSSVQIDEHYDVHYKGYVDGYEKAKRELERTSYSDITEYRNALLDVSFNFNGVLLHEIYFESLGKASPTNKTTGIIDKSFGGQDNLNKSLKAALLGSRGWVILGYNSIDKNLSLTLTDHHDVHGMCIPPVLALDVWEHAYYIDYKSNKDRYVGALIDDIDWDTVSKRLDDLF